MSRIPVLLTLRVRFARSGLTSSARSTSLNVTRSVRSTRFNVTRSVRSTVAVAMLASIAGCQGASSAATQQAAASTLAVATAVRVTAARPIRKTLRRESVQPGQIEAFEQTPLLAKLPAYVQKLYVDIGDRVEADQLLVDLFLPELKDELRQKEAALVETQAEIELAAAAVLAAQAAVATAQANLSLAEAGKIRAEADLARWQSQYARISQLVAGGSLDRKLEDETRDSFKAAEAARGEALAKVEAAKAACLQSQADLAKAKANQSVAHARQGNAEADVLASQGPSPIHTNPRPVCRTGDRAERESRRFRATRQHGDRQAAVGRRPCGYRPHLRRRSRDGLSLG